LKLTDPFILLGRSMKHGENRGFKKIGDLPVLMGKRDLPERGRGGSPVPKGMGVQPSTTKNTTGEGRVSGIKLERSTLCSTLPARGKKLRKSCV